ncbi:protein TonB [Methylomagnum ishizawai]|uniref:Protein TonB n=1 Tax=Methylomagnum ishizawai TaxID=1760988 RepID=A0A1Y6D027_9GAMM|nr:TonB family protein [Methylomagnum ishizawai]SMF93744.1 protein TonB [Methylomagnum ishizawai]
MHDRTAHDRFLIALLLAGLVHAVAILGVGFEPPRPAQIKPALAVTLARNPSPAAPKTADALAPEHQLGDGAATRKTLPEPEAAYPAVTGEPQAEQPPLPAQESNAAARRKPVLTQAESEKAVPNADDEPHPPQPQSVQVQAIEINPPRDTEAEGLRKVFINSVNAQKYKAAAYERAWQREIERIGNLHYPDEARRQKLSGSLVMVVALRQDGTVHDMKITHSSGHAALDDAAKRIVALAAPFSPFPAELRQEADVLVITRTWRFYNDSRLETE